MIYIYTIFSWIEVLFRGWYTGFQGIFPMEDRGIELFLLFITTIVLLGVLGIIILMLLFQRFNNNRISTRMGELIDRIRELDAFPVPSKEFQSRVGTFLQPRDYPYFERYIRNKLSEAGTVDEPHLLHLAKFSGFNSHIKERIRRSHGWNRTLALRTLSYLRNPANIPLFRESLATAETLNQEFSAALGLALCRDFDSLEAIVRRLYRPYQPNRDQILAVFEAYGDDACETIRMALNKSEFTETVQTVFMDFLRIKRYRPAEPDVIRLLETNERGEVLISGIEALGVIGSKASIPVVRKYLKNEHFVVRLKALVAAGKLDGENMTGLLLKAMDDDDWWVRRNAAEALYNAGSKGRTALEQVAAETEVRRGLTARMVLAEEKTNKKRLRYRFV